MAAHGRLRLFSTGRLNVCYRAVLVQCGTCRELGETTQAVIVLATDENANFLVIDSPTARRV